MKKSIKGRKIRIKNPLTMIAMQSKAEVIGILKMAEKQTDPEKAMQLLRDQFEAAYPRFADNPGQRMFLERMIKMYREVEFELWPMVRELRANGDHALYIKAVNTLDKLEHGIRSSLVLMGLAFTSQAHIPVDETKTKDPKAVSAIQKNIDKLREKIAAQLPVPPQESEALKASNSVDDEEE
jgi:hypothetical protein